MRIENAVMKAGAYVERAIKDGFEKVSGAYPVIALVGPRQAGKTTFLKEQLKRLNGSYVLLDDPDARALFEEDVKKFERQYVEGREVTLLDEVQYCKDAGRNLKYLADSGRKIWVTSSSEVILGREVLAYLVGRVSVVRLYPFSLVEFLEARGQKETTAKILERSVWEHMTYGGYPKACLTQDVELKKTILGDLYETMILKDAARTFSISDIGSLEQFAKYLAVNICRSFSYENASRDLTLSFQTVKKYLNALEKSYLVARAPPYFTNKNKEITKQEKLYFVDTGLRNAVAKTFDLQDGMLFENYVFTELLKLGLQPKYWRSKAKAEVDFVVEKAGAAIPIEVKLRAEPPRVERSLKSFIQAHSSKTALVVSYKGEVGKTRINGCEVSFTNAAGMKKILGLTPYGACEHHTLVRLAGDAGIRTGQTNTARPRLDRVTALLLLPQVPPAVVEEPRGCDRQSKQHE